MDITATITLRYSLEGYVVIHECCPEPYIDITATITLRYSVL